MNFLLGIIKMKIALRKLRNEDIQNYPEGYEKFAAALANMGDMGKALLGGILLVITIV